MNYGGMDFRIISLRKFIESQLWWHGLQFLLLDKEKWLVYDVNVELKDLLVEDELKKSNAFVIAGVNEHIKNVIAWEQFGKIDKLLNVTYVYMFLNNLKV